MFDREQSVQAGCQNFLAKPIQFSELIAILEQHLQITWQRAQAPARQVSRPQFSGDIQCAHKVPPPAELHALLKAAKAGYIAEIKDEAQRLRQLDPDYEPFAHHILELATDFEDESIVTLVESYLG